ncbi:MAG: IS607 family transposase [Methylococcaceae bacterium]
MNKFISIKEAAEQLGVSTSTLRRWEKEGKLLPDSRTSGNQRRYLIDSIKTQLSETHLILPQRQTIAYARVSSHDQKLDLERQKEILALYCVKQGYNFTLISDIGSGMNYYKKGLKNLINDIIADKIERIIITHKDRLLHFGAELVFSICETKNVQIIILNQGEETTFEEELVKDVLEIITIFSAKLYASRSKKNKKLLEKITQVIQEESP